VIRDPAARQRCVWTAAPFDYAGTVIEHDVTCQSELDALFATELGEIRALRIVGHDDALLDAAIDGMVRLRPPIERLLLAFPYYKGPPSTGGAALMAALPSLQRLAVAGRRLFAALTHPRITHLALSGYDVIAAPEPLPAVIELDVAWYVGILDHLGERTSPRADAIAALLTRRTFPAVTRLDVSRCEPGARPPHHLGGDVSVYDLLPRLELLTGLAHLRLPSLRRSTDVDALRAALGTTISTGTTVAIARDYLALAPQLDGAWPMLDLPPTRPWPAPDQVHGREALTIVMSHDDPYGTDVDLSGLVRALEVDFDTMAPAAQAAWIALWDAVLDLGYEDEHGTSISIEHPFAALDAAVAATPHLAEESGRWGELAEIFARHHACCARAAVRVRRYWGW